MMKMIRLKLFNFMDWDNYQVTLANPFIRPAIPQSLAALFPLTELFFFKNYYFVMFNVFKVSLQHYNV